MTNSSALAVTADQKFWNAGQLAALKQLGIEGATQGDQAVFLNYAQRTGLDPFARQIYMIGRRHKQGDKWTTKWTIQASIDGLRIVAERSGDYAGQTGPEYCGPDGVWRDVWTDPVPPVAARVGVLRHKFAHPLYAVAYMAEYVQTDRDGKPTAMWLSKPLLMLAKCAEALALRKAFPNDLSGIYAEDEGLAPDVAADVIPDPIVSVDPEVLEAEIIPDSEPSDGVVRVSDVQLARIADLLQPFGDRAERRAKLEELLGADLPDPKLMSSEVAELLIEKLEALAA